jgi:hypothetical protein
MNLSKQNIQLILVGAVVVNLMAIICFIGLKDVNQAQYGIISVVAGVLVREMQTIITFYFDKDTKSDLN